MFGNLNFKYGDYLMIPRGIIYQIQFDTEDNRLFIVESYNSIYTPKRYRNWSIAEHSLFVNAIFVGQKNLRPTMKVEILK